jgi:hypothetical protein
MCADKAAARRPRGKVHFAGAPPNIRLAIRDIAAICGESGVVRSRRVIVEGRLAATPGRVGNLSAYFPLVRGASLLTPTEPTSETVFIHSDAAPTLSVFWDGDGSLACFVSVSGFLVNR